MLKIILLAGILSLQLEAKPLAFSELIKDTRDQYLSEIEEVYGKSKMDIKTKVEKLKDVVNKFHFNQSSLKATDEDGALIFVAYLITNTERSRPARVKDLAAAIKAFPSITKHEKRTAEQIVERSASDIDLIEMFLGEEGKEEFVQKIRETITCPKFLHKERDDQEQKLEDIFYDYKKKACAAKAKESQFGDDGGNVTVSAFAYPTEANKLC